MDEKELFWNEMDQYFKQILSPASYTNWVTPVKPIRMDQSSITLSVPNALTKNYWEKNLAGYILQRSLELYGVEYEPIFMVVPKETAINDVPTPIPTASIQTETTFIETDSYAGQSELNPKYTFDNFVIGKDNDLASAAAMTVADSPGVTYNPLLIYGGVGLGKTHLMQAIGNEIRRKNPEATIRYATSEAFMNDFVSSIQNKSTNEFRQKYRNCDVLLVDDIQFLSNKDQTQEEFFHTFNALFDRQKQIVLTSDRLPNDINNLEERLISRFKWGLSTDITPPDLETRIAILRKKASNERIDISSDVLTYIANNVDTNIRELEGALIRVFAYSTIHGEEITIHLASQALHTLVENEEPKAVTCTEIISTVAEYFAITVEDIKGKKRTKTIVEPRQIGMYLARELTNLSFPKIGEEFGNKNHTTVIHAYDKIKAALADDSKMREDVATIREKFE